MLRKGDILFFNKEFYYVLKNNEHNKTELYLPEINQLIVPWYKLDSYYELMFHTDIFREFNKKELK